MCEVNNPTRGTENSRLPGQRAQPGPSWNTPLQGGFERVIMRLIVFALAYVLALFSYLLVNTGYMFTTQHAMHVRPRPAAELTNHRRLYDCDVLVHRDTCTDNSGHF